MQKDLISFGDIFAWSNQTIGVFAFAAITIYLMAKKVQKKDLPDCPNSGKFLYVHYIFFHFESKIGFSLPMTVAYIIAGILTALYFAGLIIAGKKYAANHEEE